MKLFLLIAAILLNTGPALADTCKATAEAKKLHGADELHEEMRDRFEGRLQQPGCREKAGRRGEDEFCNEVRAGGGRSVTPTRAQPVGKVSRRQRQLPLACISRQFGRTSAPTIPQTVQTMRRWNARTGTASTQRSAGSTASWWHSSHVTASERTPCERMFPSVIGVIG